MALKKEAVEKFFKISQQHANAQKNSQPIVEKIDGYSLEKTLYKPHTNLTQIKHKLNTNPTHISDTHLEQTKKPNTESNTQIHTNLTQTSHISHTHTHSEPSFETLVGNFKKIISYIYNQCKFNGTCEIIVSITVVASIVQIPIGSVNTTLVRLEEKGYIKKIKSQAGRGGWKKIKLVEHIYREMLFTETSHKLHTNFTQTSHKFNTEPNTKSNTSSLSGSSNIYLNTTTTSGPEKINSLNEEWLKIDIEPLSTIGFTKTHLMQIASQNILSAELVQGSIYAFAFDLQENEKGKNIKGDPINFFMGILRNGKPYAPPSNYESPQDKSMREYKEKMLKIEQDRAETEKEAINLTFNDWFSQLTEEQKKEFLPDMLRRNTTSEKLGKNKMLEGSARSHFEIELWPDIKNKILSSAATKTA